MKQSIVAPNSLRGAMAIDGMALALRLRQKWPVLVLNETHPRSPSTDLGPGLGSTAWITPNQ
jgi:hypothetical protein